MEVETLVETSDESPETFGSVPACVYDLTRERSEEARESSQSLHGEGNGRSFPRTQWVPWVARPSVEWSDSFCEKGGEMTLRSQRRAPDDPGLLPPARGVKTSDRPSPLTRGVPAGGLTAPSCPVRSLDRGSPGKTTEVRTKVLRG